MLVPKTARVAQDFPFIRKNKAASRIAHHFLTSSSDPARSRKFFTELFNPQNKERRKREASGGSITP